MKKVHLKTRTEVIRQDTTLNDNKYGGWMAVNTGAVNATVFNVPLAPGERLDFTHLRPEVLWTQPIQILPGSGGEVTVIRIIYSEED